MRLAKNGGVTLPMPVLTREQNPGANEASVSEAFRSNPLNRIDELDHYAGARALYELDVIPVSNDTTTADTVNSNVVSVVDTKISRGFVHIPRSGVLLSASAIAEDTLATSDTNYVTFAVVNLLGGGGTTAMLAATDPNTTKATGGAAWTALTPRALTIHGTAANLRVNAGDIVQVKITTTGTLANTVEAPRVRLVFATIPYIWTPRVTRTAGSPLVAPVAASLNGEVICQLSATSEANVAGFDFGDQVQIPATRRFFFETRVKISGAAASTRFVFGLGSAYNATFDSVVSNAWFRIEGNDLTLLAETDDGTTDSDDQDTARDLVADTYVVLTIDGWNKGYVKFLVNGKLVKELAGAAWAVTDLLQPVHYVQKSTGTGTENFTVDFSRFGYDSR